MKKALLFTAVLALIFAGASVSAQDMQFNQVRISIKGVDYVQWGEDIELEDGSSTPYSITYNDTTYLPLRRMSEFMDKKVLWDGETGTAYLYDDTQLLDASAIKCEYDSDIFNTVRINIDGVTVVQPNEEYISGSGVAMPYSILWNNTTYLPMRRLCELLGKEIYWNGDSRTVAVTDRQENVRLIAEKPDSSGNAWEYYICTGGEEKLLRGSGKCTYLRVSDRARGYDRIYRYIAEPELGDDGITLVRLREWYEDPIINRYNVYRGYIADYCRIPYLSDKNSQDGSSISSYKMPVGAVLDKDVFYTTFDTSPSTMARDVLGAHDIYTGETLASFHTQAWTHISNLRVGEDGALYYNLLGSVPSWASCKLEFDRTAKAFGEETVLEYR
ncbi:MAG: hypothetical protein J6N52_09420 [Clostridia bacterium]|nr:hypothetical protein [Clostridia bacterium]